MSREGTDPPRALTPSEPLPEQEEQLDEERPTDVDGERPTDETPKDAMEPPEGWEPLPRDPNYANSKYRTFRYRGVVLTSMHLEWNCVQQLVQFRGRPADVIVASSPKSGTTWLLELVWHVVHAETGPESGAEETIEYRCPHLDVAPVADNKMQLASLHELPDPRLIKTHMPYHLLPESVVSSGAKVLYISRDPRDVCVSLYHYSRLIDTHRYRGTFAEFRDSFVRGEPFYGPCGEHVKGYLEHADTVLCVTYEQLHQERAAVVRRVAAFLGRPLTEQQVEDIVRYTSFEVMKANPATNFQHWEKNGMFVENEGIFMRQGAVGDWRNYFTQEESDAFMSKLM